MASSTLPYAIGLQGRVIRAVILREIRTRFGRNRLGYVWALLDPMIHIGVLYVIMMQVGRSMPSGVPLATFLFSGILSWYMFSMTFNRSAAAVPGNRSLLFFPQVNFLNLTAARALLEMGTNITVFSLLLVGRAFLGYPIVFDNFPLFLSAMATLGLLGLSFGLIAGSINQLVPTAGQVIPIFARVLYFASGTLFTVNELPRAAREILLYNPVLQLIDLVRDNLSKDYTAHYSGFSYPVTFVLVSLALGLLLSTLAKRKLQF